ncbi:DEAD/DEAH box helicase [Olsenella sp. An290]|uniref:DEAD/DEAH box helicase n=1 Tax=Olsenella sp. An290 TaxID=1965625 RepID=UPI000B39A29A|nr:DEAD/DEAH box helicase [Olsenella sp. An290]OUO34409.1 DEAD/DEAH box helicase [Olsenella sp. An290]
MSDQTVTAAVDEGPNAPGSLGRLIPWPDDETYPNIAAEEALDLFLGWVESRGIELWPHQEEALLSLAAGDHLILGTPTGSGKSMVALGMCFMSVCTDRRAYYTAPIKALVSEKFFDLVELFGRENVGMITGDASINASAPIICCTAEILANEALREGAGADVGCVAMDEFHFYADPDRGWAWQVPLLALPRAQFLLMSATLGDTTAIAESLSRHTGGRTVDTIADAPRPVPLSYEFVDTALEGTVELALRAGEAPIYVVHFSQDAALASAQSLASYGVSTKEQREAIKEAIKGTRFTTTFGKTLQRLLGCGVGVHHAGMLPRYRLLVEKLAQQGLLPVICGTDTLGVGINVPIHTVVLTALSKFDGRRMRHLNAREFHQIVGRAGRAGFDTEGHVIAEATEYDIENARALAKAGGDPKKARKIKTKKPPEGFVGWNKQTFERLIAATPEPLRPRMKVTHSMVLAEVEQGGDAWARVHALVEESAQPEAEKAALATRADEIFATLLDAGVVCREEGPSGDEWHTTVDLPDDFALDQPLSPFLLAALELLDPESETYALDVISMAEATLEDPWQILRAQQRVARDRAMSEMKAEGIDYDERMERLQEVTWPKPLEELLDAAFAEYCEKVPWASDFALSPKSVLRDMVETASDFKEYVGRYNIARSEGLLLRYLSEAFRALDRTVPVDKRDERLRDIVAWLGLVVRTVDSSLVDEWSAAGEGSSEGLDAAPPAADEVVRDRRGLTLLVRNALFLRVRLAATGSVDELGKLDAEWGWRAPVWQRALDRFFEEHDEIWLGADARSAAYFSIDEKDEKSAHVWHVHQVFRDSDDDHDFGIWADVDLDATQDEGAVVFSSYRVGFVDDEPGMGHRQG